MAGTGKYPTFALELPDAALALFVYIVAAYQLAAVFIEKLLLRSHVCQSCYAGLAQDTLYDRLG